MLFGNRAHHGRGITTLALACACAFGGVLVPTYALAEEVNEAEVANVAAEGGQEATIAETSDNESNSTDTSTGGAAASSNVSEGNVEASGVQTVVEQVADGQTDAGQGTPTEIDQNVSTNTVEETSGELDQQSDPELTDTLVTESGTENPSGGDTPQADTPTPEPTGGEEADKQIVEDGTYMFSAALKKTKVVNVKDNSSKSGANVNLSSATGVAGQRWDVVYVADGFYNIFKHGTKLALTVLNGKAKSSSNIGIAKKNGSNSQLWAFKVVGSGLYNIVSRLSSKYVINIAKGSTKDGTNVNLAKNVGKKQQKFKLYKADTAEASTVSLSSGTYTLKTSGNKAFSVSIKSKSKKNGANALLAKASSTLMQRFHIDADGKGYYVISIVGSGKVLSTKNASAIPDNNVIQTSYTGADTQKWALHKTDNGYEFVNKSTNLALSIKGSKYASGTNILSTRRKDVTTQRYQLDRVYLLSEGIYKITTALASSKVVEVKGSSTLAGAKIQLNEVTGTLGQRFAIERVGNDDQELYAIRTAASGGLLTYLNGKVTQSGDHATALNDSNTWSLVWNGTFFSMKNLASGKVLALKGGKTAKGTEIIMDAASGKDAQNFSFAKANLILNGTYILKGAVGTVATVQGSSKAKNANIQTDKNAYAPSQRFIFKATSKTSNTYVIKNKKSGLAITVDGASHDNKANVNQNKYTGAASQKWIAQISDGGYIMLVNKESGKAFAVQGGKTTAGTNIQQFDISYSAAQKWQLDPIEWRAVGKKYEYYDSTGKKTTWNKSVYRSWGKIKKIKSGKKYLAAIDRNHTYTTIFTNRNGVWEPYKAFLCSVGAHGTPTPAGRFRIWSKSYHEYYEISSIWYWTNFGPDGQAFHSILYLADNPNVVTYASLGAWNSHGCVRCPLKTAKWIYDHLSFGTIVYVY